MSARRVFRTIAPPLLALVLHCSVLAGAGLGDTDRVTRTLLIPPTTPLTVRATVGDITVVGWNRRLVSIDVIRRAPSRKKLDAIAVTVEDGEQRASVTALQAPGNTDPEFMSSIVVHAPIDQRFGDIELFEGRISLENLRGGIRAHVQHGTVDASALSGHIRLETAIGNITLSDAELSNEGHIRLRTFNGDVALDFKSRPLHARILALSLSGAIYSDLPLTLRTAFGPRFGELTLGRGSPTVSIDVVRGDVRITSR